MTCPQEVYKNCVYKEGYTFVVRDVEYIVKRRYGGKVDLISLTKGNLIEGAYVSELKRRGNVPDPLKLTVYGVGYIGEDCFRRPFTQLKSYWVWKGMLQRCYFKRKDKNNLGYLEGVEVCEEWHCFSDFNKWFESNYPYQFEGETDYHLDKDLFQNDSTIKSEKKVYSPETCVFLPKEVNTALGNMLKRLNKRDLGVFKYPSSYKICLDKDLRFKNKEEAVQVKISESYLNLHYILLDYGKYLNEKVIDRLNYLAKCFISLHKGEKFEFKTV